MLSMAIGLMKNNYELYECENCKYNKNYNLQTVQQLPKNNERIVTENENMKVKLFRMVFHMFPPNLLPFLYSLPKPNVLSMALSLHVVSYNLYV